MGWRLARALRRQAPPCATQTGGIRRRWNRWGLRTPAVPFFGIRSDPRAIRKVVSADGEVLVRNRPRCRRVLPPEVAAVETAILVEVIRSGTRGVAAIDRPAAGKTGTAQTYRDAWFVGYVPQLATAVWVGHARAEIPIPSVPGYGPGHGGVLAAPIWGTYVAEATRGMPVQDFTPTPEHPVGTEGASGGITETRNGSDEALGGVRVLPQSDRSDAVTAEILESSYGGVTCFANILGRDYRTGAYGEPQPSGLL